LLLELQGRLVPVILVSNKTRVEIEFCRKRMELTDPFIVENGGAIFIPKGYFPEVFLALWESLLSYLWRLRLPETWPSLQRLIRTQVEIKLKQGFR
jgi:hypothetical protein